MIIGFKIVDVQSWGSTVPADVPEDMTYGCYVIFQLNNSARFIGILGSAIGSSRIALGFGESVNSFTWYRVPNNT